MGEVTERAWVPGSAILPFEGGHQFNELPVLRRRGKQKDKDYKYTVNKYIYSHGKKKVQPLWSPEFDLSGCLKKIIWSLQGC